MAAARWEDEFKLRNAWDDFMRRSRHLRNVDRAHFVEPIVPLEIEPHEDFARRMALNSRTLQKLRRHRGQVLRYREKADVASDVARGFPFPDEAIIQNQRDRLPFDTRRKISPNQMYNIVYAHARAACAQIGTRASKNFTIESTAVCFYWTQTSKVGAVSSKFFQPMQLLPHVSRSVSTTTRT